MSNRNSLDNNAFEVAKYQNEYEIVAEFIKHTSINITTKFVTREEYNNKK